MAKGNKILVTGGLGYIGSHTSVALIEAGFEVVIVDDLSNAEANVLDRIKQITGVVPAFYPFNLLDRSLLSNLFVQESGIAAVIHFAAFKAVGESVKLPLKYFQNNLTSLVNLLECMDSHQVENIVFSSSATVYGDPDVLPVIEETPFKKALSAYGSTKQMGEEIIEKTVIVGVVKAICLRYFNPVGAHASALIGELPLGVPNNLMPYVTQVAIGKRPELNVFGNDYPTKDGTCIRDYIHVVDLANAHVRSCARMLEGKMQDSLEVFNIGTGIGLSVKEIIDAFESENQLSLNYVFGERRAGDAAAIYAYVTKANEVLGWRAELCVKEIVTSAWKWELANKS